MMSQRSLLNPPWPLLLAAFALNQASIALAQEADIPPGKARTVNERVVTESPTLPSATGDAARIEAQQNRSVSPESGGRDIAMLVDHAVGMAIEGSNLMLIAGPVATTTDQFDPSKRIRNKGRKLITESQTLLGQAAADAKALSANPTVGQFHSAAKQYINTLAGIEPSNPSEMAQIAMINQAVKEVLDADHIRQMSPVASGSVPLEQLKNHAAQMKTQGTDLIRSMLAEGTAANQIPVNVATLAGRGRQLLDAAEQVGRMSPAPSNASNPGRFQDNRVEIIGGTYGTGSPRVGTYPNLGHAPGSTLPKVQSEPSPVPNNSNETTGSTGGLKPR